MNEYGPYRHEQHQYQEQPYEQRYTQEEWRQWLDERIRQDQGVQHEERQPDEQPEPKADEQRKADENHEKTSDHDAAVKLEELKTQAYIMGYEKACEAYYETFTRYYKQAVYGDQAEPASASGDASAPPPLLGQSGLLSQWTFAVERWDSEVSERVGAAVRSETQSHGQEEC